MSDQRARGPFKDLLAYLNGPEGLNWRDDPHGGPFPIWDCDHTLSKTRAWLAAHGYDVDATVPLLEQHGGVCDCRVALLAGLALDVLAARG